MGKRLKRKYPPVMEALTDEGKKGAVLRAASVLRQGGLVVFPTESFYGLGADPFNENAVRRLFKVKGRAPDRPLLLIIPDKDCVRRYALHVNETAVKLMDSFWPGGLTLVFEAGPEVPDIVTAQTGRIGLRVSSDAIAGGLCTSFGGAITGTSANPSGTAPFDEALEAADSLKNEVELVIDGGRCPGVKPSSVVDVSRTPPVLIREGMISKDKIGLVTEIITLYENR
ncbi:MAG: threonylcarbamoyl-AMP synthase [Deltaproteobacteria bacterium CG_4_8_14_3_um_filter_51_11]|nr:threonylcarbamoyl-AMP synthase [bacterium]PIP44916.1 MAG: threonylcarbamoyl-AMP synthase [Deltaproteobacteria bacterium CG23_combo_of_CG06-09_8_20_14_all_51_20]PIX19934.1 MAG: threonylcarbamoyl-AMP synthase [Deltaproteobacteria bacterium CG_4_8_14_3_um_filter_51_11]PIY21941.1 MAG: threonylcarbamoyl-AMP synthase [Deltaproteobacteria bacterium CG_4_10_14_3_um_filter_51_14]PJB37458.1 MAG: threonylcarbamoyl-AMP synthase [Deltaproteobacteria bacterium CG_4_9_14_3_um_filter_51_14]